MHHSISTTSDDFDYFRRPVGVPLPWAAGRLGPAHYPISTTSNDVASTPDVGIAALGRGLPWSGDSERFAHCDGAACLEPARLGPSTLRTIRIHRPNPVRRGSAVGRLSAAALPALLLCIRAVDVAVDWALEGDATHSSRNIRTGHVRDCDLRCRGGREEPDRPRGVVGCRVAWLRYSLGRRHILVRGHFRWVLSPLGRRSRVAPTPFRWCAG